MRESFIPFKPGSFEVTVCVFKKAEFRLDDVMLANASLRFETVQDVGNWAQKAGVSFE